MRRKRLAARILSVFVAVSCISANSGALMAMAAEDAGSDNAKEVLQSGDEDSEVVEVIAEEEEGSEGSSMASEETEEAASGETADSGSEQEAEDTGVSEEGGTDETALEEETEASVPEEETDSSLEDTAASEEETEVSDPEEEVEENAEITESEELEQHADKAEAAAEEEQKTEKEQQPEAMEIIDSDGLIEGSSQGKMDVGSWENSVEEILSVPVIDADVGTASSGCVLAGVTGTYITDADAALARINEIRLEACKEGVLKPGTAEPLTEADYVPIKWSGDLEYIARLRAAESAYTGAHARMNGQEIWSLASPSGLTSTGEVLAWNNGSSMIAGINQWYGEKADWVNQTEGAVTGHYTQMIDPANLYVGIGTFCTENTRYYNTTAGEFSREEDLSEYTMDMSGDCVQLLDVSKDSISDSGEILGKLQGAKGDTARHLLAANVSFKNSSGNVYLMDGVNWNSSDPAVVMVSDDGTTNAVSSGTAVLEASAIDGAVKASADFIVKSIEDCDIELEQTTYTYDGDPKKPAVTASYKGTALKEGTDYTVSYDNNVDAGTAVVTITGSEEYRGSVKKTFTIKKAKQTLKAENISVAFGASAQIEVSGAQGSVSYKSQKTAVAEAAEDGTVSGRGVGETGITITASGNGNYEAASASITVTVTPVSLADSDRIEVSLTATEFTYDGSEQKPGVKATCDGKELAAGTDYTAEFGESTNAGNKTVKIAGNGNFTGAVTREYTIQKAEQLLTAEDVHIVFNTSAQIKVNGAKTGITCESKDREIARVSEDGKVIGTGAGETEILITAAEDTNYRKALTNVRVTVIPIDLSAYGSDTEVNLSSEEFTYNGKEQKPEVTVAFEGLELTSGTDYEAAFGESVNAGEKTVVITGIGNYTGTIEKNYRIAKAPQTITAQDLRVALDDTGKIEVSGAQTDVSFESEDPDIAAVAADGTVSGLAAGETTITVKAREDENYQPAEAQIKVRVVEPIDLTKAEISLGTTTYIYDGTAKKPAVRIIADGIELTEGYSVTYTNNIDAGTTDKENGPKAVITGNGKAAVGEVKVPFTIQKAKQQVTVSADSLVMDAGQSRKVTVTGPTGAVKVAVGNAAVAKAAVAGNTAAAGKPSSYAVTVTGTAVGETKLTVTAAGNNNYEPVVFTCNVKVRPKAAASFKAAPGAGGKGIKLTWSKVEGATGYQIYRNGKLIKTVGNVAAWTDTGANTNGAKYTFKICAAAPAGVSGQSRSVVYYKLNRPAAPKVTNSAARKVTVKWTRNSKTNGYQVQYSLKKNFKGAKSVKAVKNRIVSKVISKLTKGKVYYVRVRAYKKVGGKTYYSAWSTVKKVRIRK
ncbi:MAG: Ig-like domain-containing protein [Lachnospiraceae bacterium]|nr:Ig-like domain-containing protein [Lachnospiraceae bacterium]